MGWLTDLALTAVAHPEWLIAAFVAGAALFMSGMVGIGWHTVRRHAEQETGSNETQPDPAANQPAVPQ